MPVRSSNESSGHTSAPFSVSEDEHKRTSVRHLWLKLLHIESLEVGNIDFLHVDAVELQQEYWKLLEHVALFRL